MKPIDVTATKTKTQSPVNVTARELTPEEKGEAPVEPKATKKTAPKKADEEK